MLGDVIDTADPRCQRAIIDDHRDDMTELLRWARSDRFERHQVRLRVH
ncbi:MAG: hypothetical protein ACYDAG_14530 [Chloroflexota bacterium]